MGMHPLRFILNAYCMLYMIFHKTIFKLINFYIKDSGLKQSEDLWTIISCVSSTQMDRRVGRGVSMAEAT